MRLFFVYLATFISLHLSAAVATAQTTVGLLVPQTGTYAAIGSEITNGFRLALSQAGKSADFQLIVEDTEIKPPVGLAKARKLVLEDKVDVLVGVVSSGVLGALRDFVHQAQVPLIVANAGNVHATGKDCSPYIVRVSFSNAQITKPLGPWLVEQGITSIYSFAPDYAAGHQMVEAFRQTFEAAGGQIVGEAFTPFRQTKDFGPYLIKAQASKAQGIFAFYGGGDAISFVKQYHSFGEDIPTLYGSGFLTSPLTLQALGNAALGITTSLHYIPTLDTPTNNQFIEAYAQAYALPASEYAVQGYDAGQLLLQAVAAGGTTRQSLAQLLPKGRVDSPRGPIAIDPVTNNVIQNVYIYTTVAGDDGPTYSLLDTVTTVQDAPDNCDLAGD